MDWTTHSLADAAKRTKTKHAKSSVASGSCPVSEMSCPRVVQSASCQSASRRICELSSINPLYTGLALCVAHYGVCMHRGASGMLLSAISNIHNKTNTIINPNTNSNPKTNLNANKTVHPPYRSVMNRPEVVQHRITSFSSRVIAKQRQGMHIDTS